MYPLGDYTLSFYPTANQCENLECSSLQGVMVSYSHLLWYQTQEPQSSMSENCLMAGTFYNYDLCMVAQHTLFWWLSLWFVPIEVWCYVLNRWGIWRLFSRNVCELDNFMWTLTDLSCFKQISCYVC